LPIITYETPRHFDAEIVQKNKYRGNPSPEIDAAWLEIGLGTPAIRLYDDDLTRLNKSDTPDRPLHRIPEEFGGGYLAMLEVFHLLHCLNSLRKAMDKEYYAEERAKHGGEKANRAHDGKPHASEAKEIANGGLEHCIDMLRVYIKCTSDVTPITFFDNVLLSSRKLPMPDFNTLHTCRNFDEIWKWNGNNERTLQWNEIGLDLGDLMHVD
jgi:hypothetical protein